MNKALKRMSVAQEGEDLKAPHPSLLPEPYMAQEKESLDHYFKVKIKF